MARKSRIHVPGGLYHVILRGNGGQPVYFSDDDCSHFYLLLQEGTCRFGYRVHAFCLMTNHIHLVLQVGDIPLSRGMQNLSFRYTRWINRMQKRTGHLFQGRFKAILVDGDSYLLELVRYIHLNPVRAGMVGDPEEYPLSGHRAYLGKETLPWLTTDWVLGQFGEPVARAQARYKSFVVDGLWQEHQSDFYGGKEDSRLLGDDHFLDKCLSGSGRLPCRLSAQNVVDKVCLSYDINIDVLQKPSQQRTVSEARAVTGWLTNELGCGTFTEIGRLFNRDVGSISSAVRRLSERMQKTPELAKRVQLIKTELESEVNNLEA